MFMEDYSSACLHAELLYRDVALLLLDDSLNGINGLDEALSDIQNVVIAVLELAMVQDIELFHLSSVTREKGRPRIDIPEEQLRFLKEHNFKNTEIANMFLVSPKTISRRIREYNLEALCEYSYLSDDQLHTFAEDFVFHNPFSGQRTFEGHLRAKGLKVQRYRIREALLHIDPRGVQERRRKALHRRKYSVCMPNSLWHIDTNHKLIRWRFIIQGGIDGFSRLPVFLKVSDNNKASTMLQSFLTGVHNYGLPSRVRCNKGRENTLVSELMICERGTGRGSCITGRSVHNQRIERFWRDVFAGCLSLFYHYFIH